MTRAHTSFAQMFGDRQVDRIEIPLIQRDYAQGRKGDAVDRIRSSFLDALCAALKPGSEALSLDFVYGDVEEGAFYPLDGQQRLTTLFLLHWYLGWRSGLEIRNQPWADFNYATRPGAREFCKALVQFQPPIGQRSISFWIVDQAWYFYTWQHDPTIQSMLVMIDALDHRLGDWSDEACKSAWARLTDAQQPAITFHVLSMAANGLTDDLYIKMNSRGKPLTEFENFKAHFEAMLEKGDKEKASDFAKKVDTDWADILWQYRGADNLIDDEFMRYFRFVTEVRAWQCGISFDGKSRIDDLADQVYGAGNTSATDNLEFLFEAFDTWHKQDIRAAFESLFTSTPGEQSAPLVLFDDRKNLPQNESPVDLFAACCRLYGKAEWTLADTLMLYAVLLSRISQTTDFSRQVRILRNLIEASRASEIRDEYMPKLLADVKSIVVDGTLSAVTALNQAQVANEVEKAALLVQHPELQTVLNKLEDHSLLRGCLAAFDLKPTDSPQFTNRAHAFHVLFPSPQPESWSELTGALLAIGDYSRSHYQRFSSFGAPKNARLWRELLTGARLDPLVTALGSLSDQVAATSDMSGCLKAIQQTFLRLCEMNATMNWRYYFVKYPVMRKGESGRYVGIVGPGKGYSVCMLDKMQMNSNYHDPYLLAIKHESGVAEAAILRLFSGYETAPRQIEMGTSGIKVQCVIDGWRVSETPTDPVQKAAVDQIFAKYGIAPDGLYAVQQKEGIDTQDRVAMGAQLLRDLVKAAL